MNTMRLAPMAAAVMALTLAACAQQPQRDRDTRPAPEPRRSAPAEPVRATAPAAAPTPPAAAPSPGAAPDAPVPALADPLEPIGVLPCDAYLARYRSCHTTIAMVEPGMIDERRNRLHATLLGRARDPDQRGDLENLCEGLQQTMDDALDGRACGTPPTRSGADFYVE